MAKQIASIIIFPLAIHQLLHNLLGVFILQASCPLLMGLPRNYANLRRSKIKLHRDDEWKYKRITVEVDGHKIDGAILGKISTLGNGRWLLPGPGNAEFYEDILSYKYGAVKNLLSIIQANGLVFNYPGAGASPGWPDRLAMAKAHQAILSFLEDRDKGIGAKEVIEFDFSLSAGANGDALKTHKLSKAVHHVFIRSKTFADLATVAEFLVIQLLNRLIQHVSTKISKKLESPYLPPIISALIGKIVQLVVKVLGWNMRPIDCAKSLEAPQIFLQAAAVDEYEELTDSSKIIDDGIIPAKGSLTKALLDDGECPKDQKIFIGVPEDHGGLTNPWFLAGKIEAFLQKAN